MTQSARPIYSFPEPEKTTAWKDRDADERDAALARAGIFRDHELDKAIHRTKLIREKMSPPEALGLSPKLEAARQKHGIPDGFFRTAAGFDRIFVFPLDPFDQDEKIPGTMLYRPQLTKQKDLQEGYRGVLISAGLTAMDRLMSHGYELGDIVMTNKNVPFARRVEQLEGFDMFVLVMRDGDLAGNETLQEDIRAGRRRVVDVGGDSGYSHQIATVGKAVADGTEYLDVSKKQSLYVQDCW
jgi:hypothetical protein